MKKIFLILWSVVIINCDEGKLTKTHEKNNFITHWYSDKYIKNKLYSTFTVDLNISDNNAIGEFCYITQFGNRIDCYNTFKGKIKNKEIFFDFNSSFGGKNGRARILINDHNISWELLAEPLGEFYAPKKSILYINENRK